MAHGASCARHPTSRRWWLSWKVRCQRHRCAPCSPILTRGSRNIPKSANTTRKYRLLRARYPQCVGYRLATAQEPRMGQIDEYKGKHLTILNDGKRCIHSRHCVLNLNPVFNPNFDGPWIYPDAANAQVVRAVVIKCPSGSLRFKPEGDTQPEQPPTVNAV